MIRPETLSDGSVRLQGDACSFHYTRLRPGVLFTRITGRDRGELGAAPLEQVRAEFERFRQPVEWFVDARGAEPPGEEVTGLWTSWLPAHRDALKKVVVLVDSKAVELTVAVTRRLSRLDDLMEIYSQPAAFQQALARTAPEAAVHVTDEPALADLIRIDRRTLPDGTVRLEGPDCAFEYRSPRSDVLLVTIAGYDRGQLGSAPLDEIGAILRRSGGPLDLFVDAWTAAGAAVRVSQEWTAWFMANRARLKRVTILVGSRPVEVTVGIARHSSRTGELIRIFSDPVQFRDTLARAVPGLDPSGLLDGG